MKPLYHLLSNDKFIYYINKDSYRVLASYNYLFTYHENATHEAYFRQINERERIREREKNLSILYTKLFVNSSSPIKTLTGIRLHEYNV